MNCSHGQTGCQHDAIRRIPPCALLYVAESHSQYKHLGILQYIRSLLGGISSLFVAAQLKDGDYSYTKAGQL